MNRTKRRMRLHPLALSALPVALLVGCGGGSSDAGLPQLSAATPGTLAARLRLASPALPEARALDMTRSVLHDLARHGLPFLRPGR